MESVIKIVYYVFSRVFTGSSCFRRAQTSRLEYDEIDSPARPGSINDDDDDDEESRGLLQTQPVLERTTSGASNVISNKVSLTIYIRCVKVFGQFRFAMKALLIRTQTRFIRPFAVVCVALK